VLWRLTLLFVTVPLLELVILVELGRVVGLVPTVVLVVVTGILGAMLARREGLRTLARFRAAVAAGRMPHQEIVEGLLVLIAGAVLLTPGLLTDLAGFLLLVPPIRAVVGRRLSRAVRARIVIAGPGAVSGVGPERRTDVVDVDYRVEDEPGPEP
jgi:UPF0716 protein FxsA